MSIVLEVVERKGGWIYFGERKWQGQEAFANSIREELELYEDLRAKVLSATTTVTGEADE
jgi:hypothetical protein